MDDRHVGKSPGMGGQRSSWMPATLSPSSPFFPPQTHRPTDSQPTVVGPLRGTVQGNVALKQKFSWLEECVLTVAALAVVSKSKGDGDGNEPKRHVSGPLRETIT